MGRRHNGGQQYHDRHQRQYHDHHQKSAKEMTREELSKALDEDFSGIGLTIAGIYKTLTTAMASLPNMELHTRQLCVSVGDDSISACIHLNSEDGCDRYQDDDEEGYIYDGD